MLYCPANANANGRAVVGIWSNHSVPRQIWVLSTSLFFLPMSIDDLKLRHNSFTLRLYEHLDKESRIVPAIPAPSYLVP
jgi:hypothetical protein